MQQNEKKGANSTFFWYLLISIIGEDGSSSLNDFQSHDFSTFNSTRIPISISWEFLEQTASAKYRMQFLM